MELAIDLDDSLAQPLYRQLYEGLRDAILSGRLPPGRKLPSTRALARQLSLSRNTVTQAYAELEAEGYLSGRQGSGSYVSSQLPEERPHGASEGRGGASPGSAGRGRLGGPWRHAGERIGSARERSGPPSGLPYDFDPGQGAWDDFPVEAWRRLLARQWRRGWRETMDYGDPRGYRPLREEVAGFLAQSRAVRCSPDEVVIVNGTQQALDLLARVLLEPGDRVAVEDPGYPSARQLFASCGAKLLPVPVDEQGMVVESLKGTGAALALVSPSHQFPTGAVLSLARRLALLSWAASQGSLVVEDDYDSGLRFEGRPLASLQGLDDSGSVVYLGSFSKVLFPSLRVGYAVLPAGLVESFVDAQELTDRQTPILEQQLLAGFLAEGHFERHLRRMRQLYRERRRTLVDALVRRLAGAVEVMGASAGMHLMVRLPGQEDEARVVERAAAVGVAVYPAAPYYCDVSPGPALVLGYAGMPEERIREGVERLARVLLD
ncbi:MAG: MocR-like pyridoxine biosynthesis transcription factor PdxR [Chloroflexota bacterium]